jgi:hypothetical protein
VPGALRGKPCSAIGFSVACADWISGRVRRLEAIWKRSLARETHQRLHPAGVPASRLGADPRLARLAEWVAMSITVEDLQRAEYRYQWEVEMLETSLVERNRAVRKAIELGWTHAQVAAATGLSRARVGQIAHR